MSGTNIWATGETATCDKCGDSFRIAGKLAKGPVLLLSNTPIVEQRTCFKVISSQIESVHDAVVQAESKRAHWQGEMKKAQVHLNNSKRAHDMAQNQKQDLEARLTEARKQALRVFGPTQGARHQ